MRLTKSVRWCLVVLFHGVRSVQLGNIQVLHQLVFWGGGEPEMLLLLMLWRGDTDVILERFLITSDCLTNFYPSAPTCVISDAFGSLLLNLF